MSDLSVRSLISVESDDNYSDPPCASEIDPSLPAMRANTDLNMDANALHPGVKSLMDAQEILQSVQTPIEFAYHLLGINEYLKEVIEQKEAKLKKKAFKQTHISDEASLASFKIQALQQQYYSSSFYGSVANPSIITTNSFMNPRHQTFHNSSAFARRNQNDAPSTFYDPRCNRSQFQNMPVNGYPQNNVNENQSRFSRMEDTFRSGLSNYSHVTNNSSVFLRGRFNPYTIRSPPLRKLNTNHSFAERSKIVQNGTALNHSVSQRDVEDDQFSCVKVGPLSDEFHLPTIAETEEDAVSVSSIHSRSSSTSSSLSTPSPVSKRKEKAEQGKENGTVEDPAPIILTNWTLILKNKSLYLRGTKMSNNKIVEKNHETAAIVSRTREGYIKTKDCLLYQLRSPFVFNKEIPSAVKPFFKQNEFPLHWRSMLSAWIDENSRAVKENIKRTKIKSSHHSQKKTVQNKCKATDLAKKEEKEKKNGPTNKISDSTTTEVRNKKSSDKNVGGKSSNKSEPNKKKFSDSSNDESVEPNSLTPTTALLKSVTKSPLMTSRCYTPPLNVLDEVLKLNHVRPGSFDSLSDIKCEINLVAKRLKKAKGDKKCLVRKKETSPENDEVENLLKALTNKTPQNTPKAVKEVFRNGGQSTDSDSDMSSSG